MGRRQGNERAEARRSGRGRCLDGSGARLALRRHPVASRREVRAQDELALETARLKTAVCLGDLIEGYPLGDARPDARVANRPKSRSRSSRNQAGCRARITLIK
jgi:hypothetical protein